MVIATAMMIDSAMAPPELPVPGVASNANAGEINIPNFRSQSAAMPARARPCGKPIQSVGEVLQGGIGAPRRHSEMHQSVRGIRPNGQVISI